jgi:hypothetical protein
MITTGEKAPVSRIIDEEKERIEGDKMIKKHNKLTKNVKLNTYSVSKISGKRDPHNKTFFCDNDERGNKAVQKYIDDFKIYWK